MDKDDGPDQNLLDTSAWSFVKSMCAYAIRYQNFMCWPMSYLLLAKVLLRTGLTNLQLLEKLRPDPVVIKHISRSTQLSTKFQLLIKIKIPTNKEASCFKSLRYCIYHANKC